MIRADVGDLIAVDPSIRSAGVSLFRNGTLIKCARIRTPLADADKVCTGVRCLRMGHAIASWLTEVHDVMPRTLAFEWPQIYQRGGGRTAGDPNDLPGLAGVGMALAGALSVAIAPRNVGLELVTFTPADWKGQLPKDAAAHHVKAALTDIERTALVDQHDALDSVGIGLHALGRLHLKSNRRRVFPGATEPEVDEPLQDGTGCDV